MKSLDDMKLIVWFIVLCNLLFGNQKVYSQAGELDPTFGTGGKVSVDFSNVRDEAFTIKVQNDQKLVIAGLSKESGNNDFSLTRLNPDGSMDNLFGYNGKLVHSLGQYSDFISDIGFQSDGKIIAIGNSSTINTASEVE